MQIETKCDQPRHQTLADFLALIDMPWRHDVPAVDLRAACEKAAEFARATHPRLPAEAPFKEVMQQKHSLLVSGVRKRNELLGWPQPEPGWATDGPDGVTRVATAPKFGPDVVSVICPPTISFKEL